MKNIIKIILLCSLSAHLSLPTYAAQAPEQKMEVENQVRVMPKELENALERGDIAAVDAHLIQHPEDLESTSIFGTTPLAQAMVKINTPLFMYLLKKGANINTKNGNRNLLHAAIKTKNRPIHPSKHIFHHSLKQQRDEMLMMIKLLIDQGIDLDSRDSYQATPLLDAAWYGDWRVVEFLIAAGANVRAVDVVGETALDIARSARKKTWESKKPAYDKVINLLINYHKSRRENAVVQQGLGLPRISGNQQFQSGPLGHVGPDVGELIGEYLVGPRSNSKKAKLEREKIAMIKQLLHDGSIEKLNEELKLHPEYLTMRDEQGNTPLLLAVGAQSAEVVGQIIEILTALDKKEHGRNQRLNMALLHRNGEGDSAFELAFSLELAYSLEYGSQNRAQKLAQQSAEDLQNLENQAPQMKDPIHPTLLERQAREHYNTLKKEILDRQAKLQQEALNQQNTAQAIVTLLSDHYIAALTFALKIAAQEAAYKAQKEAAIPTQEEATCTESASRRNGQ